MISFNSIVDHLRIEGPKLTIEVIEKTFNSIVDHPSASIVSSVSTTFAFQFYSRSSEEAEEVAETAFNSIVDHRSSWCGRDAGRR